MGLSHTVSGDIASFRTPSRVPIESLKFHFLPKQADGTPTPENPIPIEGWMGLNGRRTGKNMWHITAYSTQNSINNQYPQLRNDYGTEINTTDASIDELVVTQSQWPNTQTFSHYSNGYISIWNDSLVFGQRYDVSFKVEVTNNPLNSSLYGLTLLVPSGSTCNPSQIIDGNILIFKNINYTPYTQSGVEKRGRKAFELRICGMSLKLSKFMVTSANKSDGVFEPYSEEQIPITFPTNGKNLVNDETTTIRGWMEKNGHRYTSTKVDTRDAVSLYVQQLDQYGNILRNNIKYTSVTLGRNSLTIDTVKGCNRIMFKHNGKINDFGIYIPWDGRIGTYTISANIESMDLTTVGGFIFSDVQIELGDTMTSYEVYSSDNTFYGGYIDPVAGEIVAEFKVHTFNGEERIRDYPGSFTDGIRLVSEEFDDCTGAGNLTKCDKAPLEKNVPSTITRLGIRIGGGVGRFYFYIPDSMFDGEATVEKFNEWLSENNMTVVAKLTTPIRIPIPAQDLKAFLDHNNFWSDANDITEVTYAVTESKDILDARKLIMDGSQPHLEDASGTIASFSTDMKAPVKELKAHFTPVQEGSGDPSPANVRPIHGFTGLLLHHDGKNIIDLQSVTWSGDSNKVSYSISGGDVTITAKTSGRVGFVGSQYSIKQNVPYAWLGKKVYFGCSDVIHNNPEHICTVVVEFRDESGTRITDPTVITTNDGTKARSFTIPSNTKEFSIMFRIAQNCGTVDVNAGDYVTFKDFYIRYPADTALYEPYLGESISIEFPATKNLLDTSKVLKSIGGATFSYSEGFWSFENCGTGNGSAVWGSQVFPAGTYTIKATPSRDGVSGFRLLCSSASCGGQWLDWYEGYFIDSSNGTDKITFTTTESFKVGLCFLNNSQHLNSPGTLKCIQLERGSTATPYEPYGTVYGGYVNLIRGKLVAEYHLALAKKTDFGNKTTPSSGGMEYRQTGNLYPRSEAGTIWSTARQQQKFNFGVIANPWSESSYGNNIGVLVTQDPVNTTYMRISEDVYQAMGDDDYAMISYKLETPIEYDLTLQQLKTLKGLNNIWSDANGAIDVKYWTH